MELPPLIVKVDPLILKVWPSVLVSVSISLKFAVNVEPSPSVNVKVFVDEPLKATPVGRLLYAVFQLAEVP